MVDENYGFCPHCGENLKSDAIYCPGCGAILNQEAAMASRHNVSGMGKSPMRGTFLVAFVLLVMYAILELISSASCFMFNESMYDMMDQAMIDMFAYTPCRSSGFAVMLRLAGLSAMGCSFSSCDSNKGNYTNSEPTR